MEIKTILSQSITERFKADCVIRNLQQRICNMAESKTEEKYQDKKFTADGLEFELIGVNAIFHVYDIRIPNVELRLGFAVSSKNKLPKEKRQKVEKVKEDYKRKHLLEWNNYKVELWKEFRYEVELDKILSGDINLQIP